RVHFSLVSVLLLAPTTTASYPLSLHDALPICAVLRPGERPARRVVVGGGLRVARRAEHDHQRHDDERAEDADVDQRVAAFDAALSECAHCLSPPSTSSRMFSAIGSSLRFAYRT